MSQLPQKANNESGLNHVKAILEMNRALWGEVAPTLRAARVKWDEKTVYLYFYYDGEISEEDNESAECVATEFISSYPEYKLEVEIVRIDWPKGLPQEGELVYRRREKKPPGGKWQ